MTQQHPVSSRVFPSHSQRYPQAMAKAANLIQQIQEMTRKGPRSLIATVVDTSFHVTQGYVLATTELGDVRVYGVPYGSVTPQMRIYARQQGAQNSNRSFVFDGYAPAVSSLSTSGSLLFSANTNVVSGQILGSAPNSIAAVSSLTTAVGYYWHCFFYFPALPTSAATILSMYTGSVTTNVILDLLPSGLLRFRSGADGKGYITNSVVAPHTVHWIVVQPGLTSNELVVDALANYTALGAGSPPTFAGGANTYALTVLTDPSGNNPAPLGSWVSKIGFGASYASGAVALPLGSIPPQQDTDLPNMNVNATQVTKALYLCNDTAGGTSAVDSSVAGSAPTLTLTSGYAQVNALGPY